MREKVVERAREKVVEKVVEEVRKGKKAERGSASQPIPLLFLSRLGAPDGLDSRRSRLLDRLQQPDHDLLLVAVLRDEPAEEGVLFVGWEEVLEVAEKVVHGERAVHDVFEDSLDAVIPRLPLLFVRLPVAGS